MLFHEVSGSGSVTSGDVESGGVDSLSGVLKLQFSTNLMSILKYGLSNMETESPNHLQETLRKQQACAYMASVFVANLNIHTWAFHHQPGQCKKYSSHYFVQ